jgi:hypothetical protein
MAHGEVAEIFQVIGKMPGQAVVFADATALINGGD